MPNVMMLKHHSIDTCRAGQCFLGRAAQPKNRPGRSPRCQHVSALPSRAADSISDPILRRALKVALDSHTCITSAGTLHCRLANLRHLVTVKLSAQRKLYRRNLLHSGVASPRAHWP